MVWRDLETIKDFQFLILLLSPESVNRNWLHFEAGVGLGLGIKVIPLAIRNLDPLAIGQPLAQFQIRSLSTDDSVHALLEYVSGEEKFGTWPERDSFWENIILGGLSYTIALTNIREFVKAHCKPDA